MISSIVSILLLASLDTGTIADGSTVIELGLTDADAGGCILEVDATDYESGAGSWPIYFSADKGRATNTFLYNTVHPDYDAGSCEAFGSEDEPLDVCFPYSDEPTVDWVVDIVVPVGSTTFSVYSDGGSDTWQVIRQVQTNCGACDLYGDFDGNGQVNSTDLGILLAHYGQNVSGTDARFMDADPDYLGQPGDGVVNLWDYMLFRVNYGMTCDDI